MDEHNEQRPLDEILDGVATREIIGALRRANGRRSLAAQMLGITRSKFYRKMEALKIDPRKVAME